METDALIARLRIRAHESPAIRPPVPVEDIARTEAAIGFPLHALLRRIYGEVANGELFGLFSIRTPGATLDDDSSLVDVRAELFNPNEDSSLLGRAVPFVDLGCAQWLWVDADGAVLSMVSGELYRAPVTFAEWLEAALAGRDSEAIFAPGEPRYGRNPFTGETTVFKTTVPRGEKLTRCIG